MSIRTTAKNLFERWVRRFLRPEASPQDELRTRAGAALALCSVPLALLLALAEGFLAVGRVAPLAQTLDLMLLPVAVVLAALAWGLRSIAFLLHGLALYMLFGSSLMAHQFGGPTASPSLYWLVPVPAAMLTLLGRAHARFWIVVNVCAYATFYGLDTAGYAFPNEASMEERHGVWISCLLGVTLLMVLFVSTYERAKTTALARLEDTSRALQRARDRVSRLQLNRCELIGRISRALRSPLKGAVAAADALASQKEEALESPALDTIVRNGGRLLSVLDDLADLAEIEAGTLGLRYLRCSPRAIAEEVAVALESQASPAERRLRLVVGPDVPETIETDPIRLKQILVKLMTSALKTVDEGAIDVELGLEPAESRVRFDVRAAGGDLGVSEIAKVLRAQASSDARRNAAVVSLDPSIVCGLVSLLGGEISAQRTGGGAAESVGLQVLLPQRPRHRVPRPGELGVQPGQALAVERERAMAESAAPEGARPPASGVARVFEQLVQWSMPAYLHAQADVMRRAQLVVALAAVGVVLLPVGAGLAPWVFADAAVGSLRMLSLGLLPCLLGVPLLQRRTGSPAVAGQLLMLVGAVGVAGVTLYEGGPGASAAYWNVLIPLGAAGLMGSRAAGVWALLTLVEAAGFMALHQGGWVSPGPVRPEHLALFGSASLVMLLAVAYLLLGLYERATQATFADLTRTHEALEHSRAEAEREESSKSELLLQISHELRTPLTSILGFTDVLIEDAAAQRVASRSRRLQEIRRNGRHMLAVIDGWTDLAQLESGRLTLNRTRFSPSELLVRVLEHAGACSESGVLEVEVAVEPPLPDWVEGDAARIERVAMAFAESVAAAVRQGVLRVVASVETGDPLWIVLRIERRELGESDSRLVEGSDRGRDARDDLNLGLCRRLAEVLQGRLELQSLRRRGASASLWLPVRAASEDALTCLADGSGASAGAEADGASLALRILVAEDGADNRRLIKHLLDRLGAQPTFVENGEFALRRALFAEAENTPFDLVLMDLQMPEIDGYEATRTLRDAGFTRPIIALTAHASDTERERCLHAGFDGFAVKPIDRDSLVAALVEARTRGAASARPGRDAA